MAEETPMFDRIINKIAERSGVIRTLNDDYNDLKARASFALGDASPPVDNITNDGLIDGIKAVRVMADEGKDYGSRIDELHAEKQLIAEALGLLADDEAADANPGGQTDSEIAAEREGQAVVNEDVQA